MFLSNEQFEAYFRERIHENDFNNGLISEMGLTKDGFTDLLFRELTEAYYKKDGTRVYYLFYTFFIMDVAIEEEKIEAFVKLLDDLLLERWHKSHEDIVYILQNQLASDLCLPTLFEAVELHLDYLAWDDNNVFEKKCVRGLYYIGGEKGRPYLEKLCLHSNPEISEMAQRQLNKLND